MKRLQKLFILIVLLLSVSLVLSACGPSGGGSSQSSENNSSQQTSESSENNSSNKSSSESSFSVETCDGGEGAYASLQEWIANHAGDKGTAILQKYVCRVRYFAVDSGGSSYALDISDIKDKDIKTLAAAFGVPDDYEPYADTDNDILFFRIRGEIPDVLNAIKSDPSTGLMEYYKYALGNLGDVSIKDFYISIPTKDNTTAPYQDVDETFSGKFFRSRMEFSSGDFSSLSDAKSYMCGLFKKAGVKDITQDGIYCDEDGCFYTFDEGGKELYIGVDTNYTFTIEIAGPWSFVMDEGSENTSSNTDEKEDNGSSSTSNTEETKTVFSDVINHVLDYVASPQWADVARHFKATYLMLTDTGVDGFENFPEDEEALCFDIEGVSEDEVKAYIEEKNLDGEVHSLEGGSTRVCTTPKVGLTDYVDNIPAEGPFELYKQFMTTLYDDLGVYYGWESEMAFIDMHKEEIGHLIYFGNDLRDEEDDYTEKGIRKFIRDVVTEAFGVSVSDDDLYKDTNDDGSVDVYYVGQKDGYDYLFLAEDVDADGQYDSLMFYVKASEDNGV